MLKDDGKEYCDFCQEVVAVKYIELCEVEWNIDEDGILNEPEYGNSSDCNYYCEKCYEKQTGLTYIKG